MEFKIDNTRCVVQSFDFSANGWINIWVDFHKICNASILSKITRSAFIGKCDKSLFLGGSLVFKNEVLSFEHVRGSEFEHTGVSVEQFKDFINSNMEEIKNYCINKGK